MKILLIHLNRMETRSQNIKLLWLIDSFIIGFATMSIYKKQNSGKMNALWS